MQNYKTNCFNNQNISIKCGNHTINFDTPLVMGILNLTPDSFYDGGFYPNMKSVLKRSEQMLAEGATIIDIGACSTRPGAHDVGIDEEHRRLLPVVGCIRKEFPNAILSIDTFRSEIVRRVVVEFGHCIVNDVSGGDMDKDMFAVVGDLKVPYVMVHCKGVPETMQQNPRYGDVMGEIVESFKGKISQLNEFGTTDIVVDPGFGFGKTVDHNYQIMGNLRQLLQFNLPLLVGVSRKSMIFRLLGGDPSTSLNATTALNMFALEAGANILRVHDVKEAIECVKLHDKIKSSKGKKTK